MVKGIVSSKETKSRIDYKYIVNAPKFAQEPKTSSDILNEVNRAKAAESTLDLNISKLKSELTTSINDEVNRAKAAESAINSSMTQLRLEILQAFGGKFAEIKAVYGNLQEIKDNFESINDILEEMNKPTHALATQILTSRINNLEQLMSQL